MKSQLIKKVKSIISALSPKVGTTWWERHDFVPIGTKPYRGLRVVVAPGQDKQVGKIVFHETKERAFYKAYYGTRLLGEYTSTAKAKAVVERTYKRATNRAIKRRAK